MLAKLVGFDTYADRTLRGTMAETPGRHFIVGSLLFISLISTYFTKVVEKSTIIKNYKIMVCSIFSFQRMYIIF